MKEGGGVSRWVRFRARRALLSTPPRNSPWLTGRQGMVFAVDERDGGVCFEGTQIWVVLERDQEETNDCGGFPVVPLF